MCTKNSTRRAAYAAGIRKPNGLIQAILVRALHHPAACAVSELEQVRRALHLQHCRRAHLKSSATVGTTQHWVFRRTAETVGLARSAPLTGTIFGVTSTDLLCCRSIDSNGVAAPERPLEPGT